MNPFEFVIAIIAITTIGGIIRAKYLGERAGREQRRGAFGLPPLSDALGFGDRTDRADEVESMRLREEVKMLKDRIQTLERIAVDKENSLSRQIDDLRDR